jgi:hypothetical protein
MVFSRGKNRYCQNIQQPAYQAGKCTTYILQRLTSESKRQDRLLQGQLRQPKPQRLVRCSQVRLESLQHQLLALVPERQEPLYPSHHH